MQPATLVLLAVGKVDSCSRYHWWHTDVILHIQHLFDIGIRHGTPEILREGPNHFFIDTNDRAVPIVTGKLFLDYTDVPLPRGRLTGSVSSLLTLIELQT